MPIKSFTTEPAVEREQTIDFELDGTLLTARRPKSAAFLALAEVAESTESLVLVRAVKNFMDESLTPDSREYVQTRLDDPDDDFDIESITPIVNWITAEFTNRPTGRPSASTAPRKRTGSRSTGRSPSGTSTRKNSNQNGSSTPTKSS